MKYWIFFLILALPLSASAQKKVKEKPVTVKVSVPGIQDSAVMVTVIHKGSTLIYDTVRLQKGVFQMHQKLDEPSLATIVIYLDSTQINSISNRNIKTLQKDGQVIFSQVYLTDGQIQVKFDSIKQSMPQVSGSVVHEDFEKLNAILDPLSKHGQYLNELYHKEAAANNKAGIKSIQEQIDALNSSRKNVLKRFLLENPHSKVTPHALKMYAGYQMDVEEVLPIYEALSKEVKRLPSTQDIERRIKIAMALKIGQVLPDFEQQDREGKMISLSSLRGQYVLVDFWASWCQPCRQENPFVRQAFESFKDKGFTVLSVSLDFNRTNWLDAIVQDGLEGFLHVSDLNGWSNAVSTQFDIRAIPQNFLLDRNGVIIGRNLKGMGLFRAILNALEKEQAQQNP